MQNHSSLPTWEQPLPVTFVHLASNYTGLSRQQPMTGSCMLVCLKHSNNINRSAGQELQQQVDFPH
jgi:hypothetical protein